MAFKVHSQESRGNEEGLWTRGLWQGTFTVTQPEQPSYLFLHCLVCPEDGQKASNSFWFVGFYSFGRGCSFSLKVVNLTMVFIRRRDTQRHREEGHTMTEQR